MNAALIRATEQLEAGLSTGDRRRPGFWSSLEVEVTGGRSLATDKSLFPRGAAVFVETQAQTDAPVNRILFDQDTGGAIKTAGRADICIGIGDEAEEIAGRTKIEGQLYYLFLEE